MYHLLLIAQNDIGYKNLMKLTSWSWLQGKYYRPRVDITRLAQYNEGIICLSACLGGLPSQMFLEGRLEEAEDSILEFKRIFPGRYYLELTHTGMEEQTNANLFLMGMAQKHNLPLVITSDSHYVEKEESEYHAALVSINTGGSHKKKVTSETDQDEGGLYYQKEQYYIKTYDDLMEHFIKYHGEEYREIFAQAFENTNKIAESCNVHFKEGMKIIPQIVDNPDEELEKQCYKFLDQYLNNNNLLDKKDEYYQRLEHEIEVITKMEFSNYFFVVSEYTQWAKDNGIMVGGGRGSAAGSLVAFCMRITGIDPLKYDLLFSRFLNRGRAKRPLIEFKEFPIEEYLKIKEK